MRITMIGTGYVGLVTGACFAELGHEVVCLDIDDEKIDGLRAGNVPIYEPGLEALVAKHAATGHLTFSTDYGEAIPGVDAVFIAVGTPSTDAGKADMTQVLAATASLAGHLTDGTVVVTKSTVPAGTAADLAENIARRRSDVDFSIAGNPEFLREGAAIDDFMEPDRIVLGTVDERGRRILAEVYAKQIAQGTPVVWTSPQSAELIKYAANAFLATKISFINEMADLCEQIGATVDDVAAGIGLDPRIGSRFLSAGPGYGGSCFPKDTEALLHTSHVLGATSRIVGAAVDVNRNRRERMIAKINGALGGSVAGKRLAVLGLTFKADTDDLRESPAIDITRGLVGRGALVTAYDPEGMEAAKAALPSIDFAADAYAAIDGADAAIILTEWPEFAGLDLARVAAGLGTPVLVDLRNLHDPVEAAAAGLIYHSVGRARRDP